MLFSWKWMRLERLEWNQMNFWKLPLSQRLLMAASHATSVLCLSSKDTHLRMSFGLWAWDSRPTLCEEFLLRCDCIAPIVVSLDRATEASTMIEKMTERIWSFRARIILE